MNTIDWSNAPEGTTHYRPENDPCWYKVAGDTAYYWGLSFKWNSSPEFEAKRLLIEDMIARPEPVWNCEGLPPVGTVCEVRDDLENIREAELIDDLKRSLIQDDDK